MERPDGKHWNPFELRRMHLSKRFMHGRPKDQRTRNEVGFSFENVFKFNGAFVGVLMSETSPALLAILFVDS